LIGRQAKPYQERRGGSHSSSCRGAHGSNSKRKFSLGHFLFTKTMKTTKPKAMKRKNLKERVSMAIVEIAKRMKSYCSGSSNSSSATNGNAPLSLGHTQVPLKILRLLYTTEEKKKKKKKKKHSTHICATCTHTNTQKHMYKRVTTRKTQASRCA
jgi:hypothetical protein